MAKKSNVHPDYYKTAGREPVGQSTVHEDHKRQFASAAKTESEKTRRGKGRKQHRPPTLSTRGKQKATRAIGSTASRKTGGSDDTQQYPNTSGRGAL